VRPCREQHTAKSQGEGDVNASRDHPGNGRRHEVDFGDAPIRVEIYASDETVEIFVGADFETPAEERRRFAILNIPRNLFSEASGAAARRSSTSSLKNRVVR
jgi:hypothetical protein